MDMNLTRMSVQTDGTNKITLAVDVDKKQANSLEWVDGLLPLPAASSCTTKSAPSEATAAHASEDASKQVSERKVRKTTCIKSS